MNDAHHKKSGLRELILKKIESGQVCMHPRWHFVFKSILLASGVVLLFLLVIFLISFVMFVLRQTGLSFVPLFGLHGLRVFLFSLPWIIILLALVCLIAVECLVRRASFGYRKPVVYSLLGIILLVGIGGFVVARTPLHCTFFYTAREKSFPITGLLYRHFDMNYHREVHQGAVIERATNTLMIRNRFGETMRVEIDHNTRLPLGIVQNGGRVIVFGQRKGANVVALGIRTAPSDMMPSPFDAPASSWSCRR